jgi:trimeric autotransporter adhesin
VKTGLQRSGGRRRSPLVTPEFAVRTHSSALADLLRRTHWTKIPCRAVCAAVSLLIVALPAQAQTSFTPSSLPFGEVVVGETSGPDAITFENTQALALTISSIGVAGGNAAGDYTLGGTCPISPNTLGAGLSCSITVTFTPAVLGSRTTTLTVTDNASNSPQKVSLTGTGTAPVTLSAPSRTFVSRQVGTTSGIQTVNVANNLNTGLVFSSVTTSGPFAVASNTCGSGIAAGAVCTVGVTFTPTAVGQQQGALSIGYEAFGSPIPVALTGTGTDTGLTSITVTPANASILAGTTLQFTATGNYSNGSTQNLTAYVTWSSLVNGVATIAAGGLATGVTAGSAGISSTLGSISGSTSLTVMPVLVSISVTPANASIGTGTTQQFMATGNYSDGSTQNLTSTATWSSSAMGVATITAGGLAMAVAPGTSNIGATLNSIAGATSLTVTPVVVSISVAPANTSIGTGSTQQFTATGNYSDGSTQNLTSTATWSSSAIGVATITAGGLATGGTPGSTNISAMLGSITSSTSLAVTVPAAAFISTGNLNNARSEHTATLLNNGMMLVAGGAGPSTALTSAELYNPATGSFTLTGNLNTAREYHTAVLLNNGMVLIAGGYNSTTGYLTSAELYNPTTGSFTLTGNLNTAREYHTASLLNNGMVLIAGGNGSSGALNNAELYNPTTGSFTVTGNLNIAREYHTASLLNSGMVLIAGGNGSSGALNNAELYNPTTGSFTVTGSLNTARYSHTASLLNNGMVLIAGGNGSSGALNNAELYDPGSATFTVTSGLNTARYSHTASLLNNGMVLIAGGNGSSGALNNAELYDPGSATFTVTGGLNTARSGQTATLLNDGMVIAAGGANSGGVLTSAEAYEPATLTPPNLVSIALSPSGPTVPLNTAQQFIATGTFSDGSTEQLASVTWSSSNTAVFSITDDASDAGSAYALGAGGSTVSACTGSLCGSTTLTVGAPALESITVTPPNGTLAVGFSLQFDALGTYSDGSTQDLTSSATWSSSSSSMAVITSTGQASGLAAGSTTIIAVSGTVQGSTGLTVTAATPTLVSISVTPASTSIGTGNTQQFMATGIYSDGSTQNLTSTATWSSSAMSVATITAGGLATAVAPGNSSIGASLNSIAGATTLTVVPVLVSISVTPATASIAAGSTQQFTATGNYSDGSTQNLTSTTTWSSSANSVATIAAGGLATGVAPGSAGISATLNSIVGAASLSVTPVLVSISVTPANTSIGTGSTQQFTATGNYSDGSTQNLTSAATWGSSAMGVATIAAGGLATGVTPGSTNISATMNSIVGSTMLSVTLPTIPATYFGMLVNQGVSFPLAVKFGDFRVWNYATNTQWQGLQVCNSSIANCQQAPATYTSLSTSTLDAILANVYAPPPVGMGIQDGVLFTMSRTPSWATQAPGYSNWQPSYQYAKNTYIVPTVNNSGSYVFVALNAGTSGSSEPASWNQTRNGTQSDGNVMWQNIGDFTTCNFANGSCVVPPDLYPDGSGANQIWDNWVVQIATYLNGTTYLQSHPHIRYWEPQNEWFVDDTVNFESWGGGQTDATFAQMLRLTEDTRCIIKGSGTIHNYPSQANSMPCAGPSGYLQTLQSEGIGTGSAIDPGALIVEPSNDPNSPPDMTLSQNFLYCNANPANDYNEATTCTWAPSGGVTNCSASSCWGSAAVDVINYHFYDYRIQPEAVDSIISEIAGFTSATDHAKPLISGEGSTGCNSANLIGCSTLHIWQDDASRAGFIPRFYALYWSYGLTYWPPNGMVGNWWNAYNSSGELYSNGTLTPEGVAYNTTYGWLVGATPSNNPFCTASENPNTRKNTIYTCSFTKNGAPAQLVWDSEFGPGGAYGAPYADCSTSPNPTICGNTTYNVPSGFNGWNDINYSANGTRYFITSGQVTIGAVPILLVP